MQLRWWRRLTVYLVAAGLMGGSVAHAGFPVSPVENSNVASAHAADHHSLNKACFNGPQHPACGACFRSVDLEYDIVPTFDVPWFGRSTAVAWLIHRPVDRRLEGDNPIRAPPAIPA